MMTGHMLNCFLHVLVVASLVVAAKAHKPCALGTFQCGNTTVCVKQENHCNGQQDCPNGEDESYTMCVNNAGWFEHIVKNRTIPDRNITVTCGLAFVPLTCKCVKKTRLDCSGRDLSNIPSPLPANVSRLYLMKNNIRSISGDSFEGLNNIDLLHLEENRLVSLRNNTFSGLRSLEKLSVANNSLALIEEGTFKPLTRLIWLFLQFNDLRQLPRGIFQGASGLEWIDLRGNKLQLYGGEFEGLPELNYLDLEGNHLTNIGRETFQGYKSLRVLILRGNRIVTVAPQAFDDLQSLLQLDLLDNNIMTLDELTFTHNIRITKLSLGENPLHHFPRRLLSPLTQLKSLNLTGVLIPNIDSSFFSELKQLHHVHFEKFSYCHKAIQVPNCFPKTDGLSTIENMLADVILRALVWVMALTTCIGNLFVMLGRLMIREENRMHSILVKNLAASDFLMGIYLMVIGAKDANYRDNYNMYANEWRTSWECRCTGCLAMASSEVSILILTYLTLERFVKISYPYTTQGLTGRKVTIALCGIWTAGILLAVIPVTSTQFFGDFYGTNGVCFPLHIYEPYEPGWQYSSFVFLGLNSVSVLIIALCYASMFCSIQKTRQLSHGFSSDNSFALRFFFIVLTDALCWAPIIIIKVIALTRSPIPDEVHAWVAVFVLPINSAINPVLYSLTTVTFRTRLQKWGCCLKARPQTSVARASIIPSQSSYRQDVYSHLNDNQNDHSTYTMELLIAQENASKGYNNGELLTPPSSPDDANET